MKNITISIDDETYRRARLWAAERDTSVSAVVRCILTTLPARAPAKPARSPTGSIQASAADVALIPSWGLSVLRTTLRNLGPSGSQRQSHPAHTNSGAPEDDFEKNTSLACESVTAISPAAE
jgi:hypothetical protein